MPLAIRLLGRPSIDVDGVAGRPPRGRKSWGLLAYILLAERPPSRKRLAALLFDEADDPLGALRWSLAEIRRSLRPYAEVSGDPVTITFAVQPPAVIDIVAGGADDATGMSDGELLEGMSFAGCEAFETWLLVARRRVAGTVEAVLREEAFRQLTVGRPAVAVTLAARLVARNPLDETFQELLVRCLATSGQRDAALTQAAKSAQLVRRELGIEPSPSVRRAADAVPGTLSTPSNVGRATARAQLEAGHAAISAGAVDVGIERLRRAVADAKASGDAQLHLEALVELGGALVHAVRGADEEGTAVLHDALGVARDRGDARICAKACRELGFVDVLAGRRDRADGWLDEAEVLADGDGAELAAILGVRGMNLSDCARYAEALAVLGASIEHADRAGSRRQQAWSMSLIGRLHHLQGRTSEARGVLDQCLALVRDERWTAFSPWPETLLADVDLAEGRVDLARDGYVHAYALACQLADPCWEGVAARGLAMVEARTGELTRAMTWLDDGRSRCIRWPDPYQWVHASVLDATCDVAIAGSDPRGPAFVDQLAALASRTGMRELVVRSHLHRVRLGQPGAIDAAAMAAAEIDNPLLTELVQAASAHG